MKQFKIRTENWGELEADQLKINGPFVVLLDVTRAGHPFSAHCMIPAVDCMLIEVREVGS